MEFFLKQVVVVTGGVNIFHHFMTCYSLSTCNNNNPMKQAPHIIKSMKTIQTLKTISESNKEKKKEG